MYVSTAHIFCPYKCPWPFVERKKKNWKKIQSNKPLSDFLQTVRARTVVKWSNPISKKLRLNWDIDSSTLLHLSIENLKNWTIKLRELSCWTLSFPEEKVPEDFDSKTSSQFAIQVTENAHTDFHIFFAPTKRKQRNKSLNRDDAHLLSHSPFADKTNQISSQFHQHKFMRSL